MPPASINFVLAFHAHQPVGNFPDVFAHCYGSCYEPLLAELAGRRRLKFCLHVSGPLLEWLEANRPQALDLIRRMVAQGRLELIGGGLYEPILVMLSEEDRRGQMTRMASRLEERFGVRPVGVWLAERVWEQCLASSIADAGHRYVCVDDFHFRYAGMHGASLDGWYATEDQGRTLAVFPISEALRFRIPWLAPEEAIGCLRGMADDTGRRVAVYADDAEKFGSWPGTFALVYEQGWLRRFLDLLEANAAWIRLRTFSETLETVPPLGKAYLPDASYREMTEWALPAEARIRYESAVAELRERGVYDETQAFLKGASWRNFLTKYPEAGEMHGRMTHASGKVNATAPDAEGREAARTALYRGQCNCAYWHGTFGGVYLPHLRHAVYEHLIKADTLAERAARGPEPWAAVERADVDLDGVEEVVISTDAAWLSVDPARGGRVCEHDIRALGRNLLGGLARRRESYHREVLQRGSALAELLHYDTYRRGAFLDRFLPPNVEARELQRDCSAEAGDFLDAEYGLSVAEPGPEACVLHLGREGVVRRGAAAVPVRVGKTLSVARGSADIRGAWAVTNLSESDALDCLFGVEFNFAIPGGDMPGRYAAAGGEILGNLCYTGETARVEELSVVDETRHLCCDLRPGAPCRFLLFPIVTVSRNVDAFEPIYQSTVIVATWPLSLPPGGTFRTEIDLVVQL